MSNFLILNVKHLEVFIMFVETLLNAFELFTSNTINSLKLFIILQISY